MEKVHKVKVNLHRESLQVEHVLAAAALLPPPVVTVANTLLVGCQPYVVHSRVFVRPICVSLAHSECCKFLFFYHGLTSFNSIFYYYFTKQMMCFLVFAFLIESKSCKLSLVKIRPSTTLERECGRLLGHEV